MTHVIIQDTTTVYAHGVSDVGAVTGPLTFDCESVDVSGVNMTGTVIVSSGTALRLLRYSPHETALHVPMLCIAFMLALICTRFRL